MLSRRSLKYLLIRQSSTKTISLREKTKQCKEEGTVEFCLALTPYFVTQKGKKKTTKQHNTTQIQVKCLLNRYNWNSSHKLSAQRLRSPTRV